VSQLYRCAVNVTGCNNLKMAKAVKKAIEEFWCFEDPSVYESSTSNYWIDATGEGNLGGEVKEFAKELAINIWKANQGPCEVSVDTIYMEDLPTDSFVFDESKYVEIMAKA
jgi:hypothetical protein